MSGYNTIEGKLDAKGLKTAIVAFYSILRILLQKRIR